MENQADLEYEFDMFIEIVYSAFGNLLWTIVHKQEGALYDEPLNIEYTYEPNASFTQTILDSREFCFALKATMRSPFIAVDTQLESELPSESAEKPTLEFAKKVVKQYHETLYQATAAWEKVMHMNGSASDLEKYCDGLSEYESGIKGLIVLLANKMSIYHEFMHEFRNILDGNKVGWSIDLIQKINALPEPLQKEVLTSYQTKVRAKTNAHNLCKKDGFNLFLENLFQEMNNSEEAGITA